MCESETSELRREFHHNSLVWVPKLENFCPNPNSELISNHHQKHHGEMTKSPNRFGSSNETSTSDLQPHHLPYQSTPSERDQVQFKATNKPISKSNDNHQFKLAHVQTTKINKKNMNSPNFWGWKGNLLNLIVINTILSQLNENFLNYIKLSADHHGRQARNLPRILFADALECLLDGDCGNSEKICHENKCICAREKPIESSEGCLAHALLSEQCFVNEQCLGNSLCLDGACACGNNSVTVFNPSSKIDYCHPKRRLNEECNYDLQCPGHSYCSTGKNGCLCENGFAPPGSNDLDKLDDTGCIAKSCSSTSECESEFFHCHQSLCKCLATHFDPTTARCYKFGSTGGKASDELSKLGNNSIISDDQDGIYNIRSIMKDLTENSDRMWLVLIIMISFSILLLVLVFRKYCLGYCWTAHKKEYEPNNKAPAKNGYFNKNSINNKSFRQKNGETDEGDLVDDKNDGTAFIKSADKNHGYVRVNINDNRTTDNSFSSNNHHHEATSPLKTSTSTPV